MDSSWLIDCVRRHLPGGAAPEVHLLSDQMLGKVPGPVFGHLFGLRHHAVISTDKARRLNLPAERGFVAGHRQTYEWFLSSPFADAPDAMSDPVWGAGYDFAAEAKALALP